MSNHDRASNVGLSFLDSVENGSREAFLQDFEIRCRSGLVNKVPMRADDYRP